MVATVTVRAIYDAIESTMGGITGIARAQGPDDLREGAPDLPLLRVLPASGEVDESSPTERATFTGGKSTIAPVRRHHLIVHADVLVCLLGFIAENMNRLLDILDAAYDTLELQRNQYFGLAYINNFHWKWERVVAELGTEKFVALRFTLDVYFLTQG